MALIDTQVVFDHVEPQLTACESLEDVQGVVKVAARQLADAEGATFVLLDGDQCYYADEDAISPLWKGQRFPVGQCISGWAMLHRETVVISDIRQDERIPQEAYRPTFVRSLAMVPIAGRKSLGAIGAYWSQPVRPSDAAVKELERLADLTATALRRFPQALPDPRAYRADN